MQSLVKKVTLDKIVLETDAPFLIPEPLKSNKVFPNRPENVKIIANKIAKIKGDSFFKVAQISTKNAKQLFRL
jgi:TatD DNase family protein